MNPAPGRHAAQFCLSLATCLCALCVWSGHFSLLGTVVTEAEQVEEEEVKEQQLRVKGGGGGR